MGEGTEDTRRQVRQKDLVTSPQSETLTNQVIQKLADEKLLVTSELKKENADSVAVVDIAHEALIRHWPRLKNWINENRSNLGKKRTIETAAEEWSNKNKSRDYLLQGLKLEEAKELYQSPNNEMLFSNLTRDFIQQSIQWRIIKRSISVFVISMILGGFSYIFHKQQVTEMFAKASDINALNESSSKLFKEGKKLEALSVAIEAAEKFQTLTASDDVLRFKTIGTLQEAVYNTYEINQLQDDTLINKIDFHPTNGQMMAYGDDDGIIWLRQRDCQLIKKLQEENNHTAVKKYSSNTKVYFYSMWDYSDYAKQLHFLSAPELAEDIQKYIRDKTLADGIKEFFIELTRHGRLTECVDAVLAVLKSSNAHDHLTWIAVLTVRDAGSLAHRQQLARIAIHYPSISERLCDALCSALYPDAIDVDDLITLLERTEQPHKFSTLLQKSFEGHFKKDLSQDHLKRLLAGLNRLMNQPPLLQFKNKTVAISERYAWLGQILVLVVKRLLQYQQLGEELVAKAAKALIILDSYNKYQELWNKKVSLVQELQYHQAILRAYVWQRIELLKANKRLSWYDIFPPPPVAKIKTIVDLKWLLEDVATIKPEVNRVALQLAIDLWNDSGRPRQYIKQFQRALQKQPTLQQFFHKQVENWLIWKAKHYYHYRWEPKYYEWGDKKIRLQNWFQEKGRYWRNRFWLLRHLKDLRESKEWRALYSLINKDSSNINEKGLSNWQAIIPIYGKNIVQAARQGLKSFWRTYNPLDDIDKPDNRIQVGLTGLTIAITEGLKFSDLSESEATIATAYAANEINGFPDWLSELAAIHPQAVRQVLSQYIQRQWQSFNGEYYLRDLRYSPPIL